MQGGFEGSEIGGGGSCRTGFRRGFQGSLPAIDGVTRG